MLKVGENVNTDLFIDGALEPGEGLAFDVLDPATGTTWNSVPAASESQVDRAVDEAFALAADTPYGLGASVYTLNAPRIQRAFQELKVGTVWANDPVVDNLAAPFGGMRASGNVRELGMEGMETFTVPRHVHWNLKLESKPWWYPYEEES